MQHIMAGTLPQKMPAQKNVRAAERDVILILSNPSTRPKGRNGNRERLRAEPQWR